MNKTILLSGLLFFASMTLMMAHGVITEVNIQSPSIIVKSSYSESEPLKGALVKVFGHGNEESPYQTGKTDDSGFFAFVPDITGEWIFIVDDQQGHMKKVIITVHDSFFTSHDDQVSSGEEFPMLTKVLIGLTWIFGLTSLFYGIRTYQVGRNKKSEG
jgi:nickel transport protein